MKLHTESVRTFEWDLNVTAKLTRFFKSDFVVSAGLISLWLTALLMVSQFAFFNYKAIDESLQSINERTTKVSFTQTELWNQKLHTDHFTNLSRDVLEQQLLMIAPEFLRERAKPYLKYIVYYSQKYQVDPLWVMSIIWTESHFKNSSKSHVGAVGLMQLMPATSRYLAKKLHRKQYASFILPEFMDDQDFFKQLALRPASNIEIGVYYLSYLHKKFYGNHVLATVAYNMGPGWVYSRMRKRLPIGKRNQYLNKVRRSYSFLARRFKKNLDEAPVLAQN